tara:strand:- start:44 stop:388 length:345 start_codon:yes stop_codon:yes gene_type:complete
MELGDVGKYDQLVLVVVQENDAGDYMKALSESGFAHTRILSAGGFLRATNALFVVAISSDRLADLRALTSTTCTTRNELVTVPWVGELDLSMPVEVEVGGASMFVMPLDRAERL